MDKKSIICASLAAAILYTSAAIALEKQSHTAYASSVSIIYGDVDQNNTIDSFDALTTLRASAKITSLSALQTAIADVDGDEVITASDALDILRFSAGMRPSYHTGQSDNLDTPELDSRLPLTVDSDKENSSASSSSSTGTSSKETSSSNTSSKTTSSHTTSSNTHNSSNTTTSNTSSKTTSAHGSTSSNTSSKTTSSKATSSQNTSSKTTSSKVTSSQNTSSKTTSSNNTSSKVTSSQTTSSHNTSSTTSSHSTSSQTSSTTPTCNHARAYEKTKDHRYALNWSVCSVCGDRNLTSIADIEGSGWTGTAYNAGFRTDWNVDATCDGMFTRVPDPATAINITDEYWQRGQAQYAKPQEYPRDDVTSITRDGGELYKIQDPLYRRRVQDPETGIVDWDYSSELTPTTAVETNRNVLYHAQTEPDENGWYGSNNEPGDITRWDDNIFFKFGEPNIYKAMKNHNYTRFNGWQEWLNNGHMYVANASMMKFNSWHGSNCHGEVSCAISDYPHEELQLGKHMFETAEFYIAQEPTGTWYCPDCGKTFDHQP